MIEFPEDRGFIDVNEAIRIAKAIGICITRPTALKWIKDNNLGHQPGRAKTSRWVVNKSKWKDFLYDR
jgi:hypothetical protein